MTKQELIASLQDRIDSIGGKQFVRTKDNASTRKPASRAALQNLGENAEERSSDGKDAEAALKRILAWVNVSDKSELAIRKRLAREDFGPAAIDEAVLRAIDYGFIDDCRYAEILIRSRLAQGRGSAGIVRELAENGIDVDEVRGWPYEYPVSHDDEIDRALMLLDRKPPRSKNVRESAYRRLVQKGYPVSVASSAARMWVDCRP